MTELAKIEGAEGIAAGLSDKQARFVEALIGGASEEEAKVQAGYAETTPIVSILRGKLVENAISAFCDGALKGALRLKALKTLEELLGCGSAQVRLGAVKLVLEQADEADQGEEKPQEEMTIEELEALIRRKEAQLKQVTPSNGA
jgi:phage terminase small subunit